MKIARQFSVHFALVPAALLLLFLVVASLVAFTTPGYAGNATNAFLSPLPERPPASAKPATWVYAADGGELRFGAVTVAAPTGFTRQGGADIRANFVPAAENLTPPANSVAGALFALGVWPPNDQTQFEQPLELRILLDLVVLSEAEMNRAQVVQYDPAQKKWLPLPGVFRPQTYELVTHVSTFTPVAKDFPVWGGRTFFAVVRQAAGAASPGSRQPAARSKANIRSGPGTSFEIVRTVKAGETLVLDGVSADGKWLRLADGSWIAAFLATNVPPLPVVNAE